MADVKALVIDRSKWLRGRGNGTGRLLKDGKMCCLGFFGRALGIPDKTLLNSGTPYTAPSSEWPRWLYAETRDTPYCALLVDANDKRGQDEAREQKIAAIFARHGVEVRFVDGMEQPPAGPQEVP